MLQQMLSDLMRKGWTLQRIADACGFSSRGHVHDFIHGHQKTVAWEIGQRIVAEHKKANRRKESKA